MQYYKQTGQTKNFEITTILVNPTKLKKKHKKTIDVNHRTPSVDNNSHIKLKLTSVYLNLSLFLIPTLIIFLRSLVEYTADLVLVFILIIITLITRPHTLFF